MITSSGMAALGAPRLFLLPVLTCAPSFVAVRWSAVRPWQWFSSRAGWAVLAPLRAVPRARSSLLPPSFVRGARGHGLRGIRRRLGCPVVLVHDLSGRRVAREVRARVARARSHGDGLGRACGLCRGTSQDLVDPRRRSFFTEPKCLISACLQVSPRPGDIVQRAGAEADLARLLALVGDREAVGLVATAASRLQTPRWCGSGTTRSSSQGSQTSSRRLAETAHGDVVDAQLVQRPLGRRGLRLPAVDDDELRRR